MFPRCFLHSLLVNLLLLASLEERSTYGELDCFLEVGDDSLNRDDLVNETTRNVFALFWKTTELPVKKALPYF